MREHKRYTDYDPDFIFSKPSASVVRQATTTTSMGQGFIFVSLSRSWLDGKYVRWNWTGSGNYPSYYYAYVLIYDGEYDRSNNTDFPSGSEIPDKGNGLLQTLSTKTATFSWEVLDVQVDVSGGSQDTVTLFFKVRDPWADTSMELDIDWIEFNMGSGGSGTLKDEQFTDSVHMEQTGTTGDYGYISMDAEPENSVTLNAPSDESYSTSLTVNFNYTPVFYETIQNATVWTNGSQGWQSYWWNTSIVQNDTSNIISGTYNLSGTYIWNVQVFNTTGSYWFASSNWTLTVVGWLSGWSYRKSLTIGNVTGAGTDYQQKIVVGYGDHRLEFADCIEPNPEEVFLDCSDSSRPGCTSVGGYSMIMRDPVTSEVISWNNKYWLVTMSRAGGAETTEFDVFSSNVFDSLWNWNEEYRDVLAQGTWDAKFYIPSAFIYLEGDSDPFVFFYCGYSDSQCKIGAARSNDMENWTKSCGGEPVWDFTDDWCINGVEGMSISRLSDSMAPRKWIGVFEGEDPVDYPSNRIGIAYNNDTAPDTQNWQFACRSHTNTTSGVNDETDPWIFRDGLTYYIFYEMILSGSSALPSGGMWANESDIFTQDAWHKFTTNPLIGEMYGTRHACGGLWAVIKNGCINIPFSGAELAVIHNSIPLRENCKNNFADIRITRLDGITIVAGNNNGWMQQKVDSDYAVIWFEVTENLNDSAVTYYLYYGKSDATWSDNGTDTFLFFDDFLGTSLDSKWTVDSEVESHSVSNSKLTITEVADTWNVRKGVYASYSLDGDTPFALYAKIGWSQTNNLTAPIWKWGVQTTSDVATWHYAMTVYHEDAWAASYGKERAYVEGTLITGEELAQNGSADVEIKKAGSGTNDVRIDWNQSKIGEGTANDNITKVYLVVNNFSGYPFATEVWIDSVLIRKYSSPEPKIQLWGSEEEAAAEAYVVDVSQSLPNSWSTLTETLFQTLPSQILSSLWTVLTTTTFNLFPSQSLTTAISMLSQWNAVADLIQSIGNSWSVLIQSSFNILPSVTLTAAWLVLIVSTFAVGLSQAIGSSWAVLTKSTFGFLSSLGLSSSWNALTSWNIISLPSLSLSSSWTVEAIKLAGAQYIADLSQSLSTSWSILIQTAFKTLPSQIISNSWAILTEWSAIIGLDQNFNNSWTILVQSTLNVFPSLSFTTSWLVDAVKLAGAQYVADLTQSISSSWQILTETMFHVTSIQSLTTSWAVLTESSFGALLSSTFSSTWAVLTVTTFGVLSSFSFTSSWIVEAVKLAGAQHFAELTQNISTTWSILIQSTFNVLPTSALTTAWQVLTLTTFNLLPSFSFNTSWIVEAIKLAGALYIVDLSQTITSSWGILTEAFYNIIPTQTLTSTWSVLLTWSSNTFPTQSLSSSWTVLTTSTFSYLSSLGLTSSWAVEAVKLAGAYYIVDLAQSLSTTWNILTELGFNVIPSIGLSASWNILCQSTFNLATSLSSSFSWIVEAVKFAGAQHFADLTQSLSTSWNVARAWAATVAFPQTFSTSWQTLTEWAATLGLSQSLSTAWTILSGQSQSVALSVSVATSWTVDIIKGVLTMSVDLTMTIITSWLASTFHQIYVPLEASVLEMIVVFCTAIFFTILYMGKEKILWGLFAFASWLTVAFLWLFINPVAYTVAFLFLGIAIVILLTVILILFQQIQLRRKGEPEESDLD